MLHTDSESSSSKDNTNTNKNYNSHYNEFKEFQSVYLLESPTGHM